MAVKKYLSLERLTEYDELIKGYVDKGLGGKAASTHTHDDRYYTESEIDTKLATINENVTKITNGDTTVSKATSATYASTATNASTASYAINAESATNATSATNASTANYAKSAGTASLLGTSTVGSATQPIYLNAGSATTCTKYAGGTLVKLNNTSKSGSSVSIYAPTTGGTAGYVLKSAGTGSAPVWSELDAYTKAEVDTKLGGKSDTSHNHDDKYDAKGASTAALADAKTYADNKVKGLATTAVVDTKISTHNSSTTAHSDIRTAIAEVKEDVDAFFKDATISEAAKDTLKEIQEYITSDTEAAAAMTASINNKAEKSDLTAHTESTAVHVGTTDRTNWNAAYNHVSSTTVHITSAERTAWNAKASTAVATTATAGLMSSADKTKLDGIVNGTTATKGLVQLTNSTSSTSTTTAATPNSVKQAYDKATTAQTNLDTHTASTAVHITADERTKLSGIEAGANNYTLPVATKDTLGGVKTGSTVTSTSGLTAAPIINGIPYYKNTTYSNATTAANGLMTSAMVTKLNGIAEGANKTIVDSALSATSTNPVENKAVNSAIVTLTSAVTANTNSITSLTTTVSNIQEITSEDIEALFD